MTVTTLLRNPSVGAWLLLSLAASVCATVPTQTSLQWSSCNYPNQTLPLECSNITVPLDYSDPNSTESFTFSLVRACASTKPSKGSILFNFGGPGEDGVYTLAQLASTLQNKTGGQYDVVSFDPRGVAKNLNYTCFQDAAEQALFTLSHPVLLDDAYDGALGRVWVDAQALAQKCAVAGKAEGELLGTAFVARDMMRIVDALGEDGLLRYWGFSYGTILGATTAAMFPERIDKMVLDGVVNAHDYYHGYDVEQISDADQTLSAILAACLASPANCAYAGTNATVASIEQSMQQALERYKQEPLLVGGTVIDYSLINTLLFSTIKTPTDAPAAFAAIKKVLERDTTTIQAILSAPAGAIPPLSPAVLPAIKGSDRFRRVEGLNEFAPHVADLHKASKWFASLETLLLGQTLQWRFAAKERYAGNFDVATKHPILFIGNSFDPITPLRSARNMSETFPGAALLEHEGYGASDCTNAATRGYFSEGTLPKTGTRCKLNAPLFEQVGA